MKISPEVEQLLEDIAKRELGIETLKTRNRDSLDFHNLGVASIKDALLTAYLTGMRSNSVGMERIVK